MTPEAILRTEFNGLVLKMERELVVQAHMWRLLAATTARLVVLKGDMARNRRRLRRSKRVATPRRR